MKNKIYKANKRMKEHKSWVVYVFFSVIVGICIAISKYVIEQSTEIKYGELHIVCNTDSAKIILNKNFKGYTSLNNIVKISSLIPGTHLLSISKEGYSNVSSREVKIIKGEISTQNINLQIITRIDEAKIEINKKFIDKG